MTPRKPRSPDAITQREAAEILGTGTSHVKRLLDTGVLTKASGQSWPLSRRQAEEHLANPKPTKWVTGTEAAAILGISKSRTSQIADKGLLPFEVGANGRRRYRRTQVEVISRARQIRWHPVAPVE